MSRRRGAKARRTNGQRFVVTLNSVAIVGALVVASILAYGNTRISDVTRIPLSESLSAGANAEGDGPTGPLNFLVVGVDDASRLDPSDPATERAAGDLAGQHTDSIMIVRIDPEGGTVRTLSLPRDLWVEIADTDGRQRINFALASGGPSRLIKTIVEDFGIPINHYLQVDFAAFGELIGTLDGIPVDFPHPVRSRAQNDEGVTQAVTELNIEEAGCWVLGPRQALAFARERKGYQVQDGDGDWHLAPGGDFFRIERQQLLIRLALQRAISQGARNPNVLRRIIDDGIGIVAVDDSLTVEDLVDLALPLRDFNPAAIEGYTIPVTDLVVGGAEVLELQEEAAAPTLELFRPSPTPPADAEDLVIQVLNGSGVQDQAAEATYGLGALGYATEPPLEAAASAQTRVQYAPGFEQAALAVAGALNGPAIVEASASGDVPITVVTGEDWEGVREAPDPESPTDSSTTTDVVTASTVPQLTGDPVDDPDLDDFYRARAPSADATCRSTE